MRSRSARAPLLTLVAGGLLAASYQPLNFGPVLGWVVLLPLLYALRGQRRWPAFWLGWLFGLIVNLSLLAVLLPIPNLHLYQVLLIAAYLACYPALWSGVISSFGADSPAFVWFGAAMWVVLDYLKAHAAFLSFPIGSLAQTQVDNPWLLQCASLFGEAAVTWLIVWGNLALWRALHGARASETLWCTLPILLALGFGAFTTVTAEPDLNRGMRVAALHTEFNTFGHGHVDAATRMQRTLNFIAQTPPPDARLIVLPESSFVNPAADPTRLAGLQKLADKSRATWVVGVAQSIKFDRTTLLVQAVERKARAGAWIFEPETTLRRYDKVHRVAFAEYLPLARWVTWPAWLVAPPIEIIETANAEVYPTKTGWPIGIMVCWESVVAGHARTLVQQGAGVLLLLSNEGWFSGTAAGLKHNATVSLRAVETGRPIIVSSNAGPAIIVDRFGRVVTQSVTDGRMEWIAATVEPRSELSLYSRLGDLFVALCAVTGMSAWLIQRRRLRRAAQDG